MTDQELLEYAALATGIKGTYQHWYDSRDNLSCGIAPKGSCGINWWNPLTNDATRYRMAKELGLTIDFSDCTVYTRLANHTLIQEFWGADTGTDEAHAIVKVAVEIWLSKNPR